MPIVPVFGLGHADRFEKIPDDRQRDQKRCLGRGAAEADIGRFRGFQKLDLRTMEGEPEIRHIPRFLVGCRNGARHANAGISGLIPGLRQLGQMRAQVLLRQLDAVTVKRRRSTLVHCDRGLDNRDVGARPQLDSDFEEALRARLDFSCAPVFAIAKVPIQLEMAQRKQRPLFSIRAVAKLGIVARQGEVANGMQPFRMHICRSLRRAFHTIRA